MNKNVYVRRGSVLKPIPFSEDDFSVLIPQYKPRMYRSVKVNLSRRRIKVIINFIIVLGTYACVNISGGVSTLMSKLAHI